MSGYPRNLGFFILNNMEISKGNLYKSNLTGLVVMACEKTGEKSFSGQVIIDDIAQQLGTIEEKWDINYFQPYSAEIILKEVIDFSKVQFLEMASGEILLTNGNHKETNFCGTRVVDGYFLEWWKKDSVKRVVTPNFK